MKANFSIILSILILTLTLTSCKINQRKNGAKTGRWIYKDAFLNSVLKSKGRYKNDLEVGTWKEYTNKRLTAKHKYRDSLCYTEEYHRNGKIRAIGISKMIADSTTIHWFLSGEWKFYDKDGVLLGTKIYEKGEPILETYTE